MKIRIEIFDDLDNKTSMVFEGKLYKERIINFLDAFEFSVQEPNRKALVSGINTTDIKELTIKERMEAFLKYDYPRVWFTSLDVKREYEKAYGDKINLSTVSTYLARMHRDELVDRRGNRTQREYKITEVDEVRPTHPEETSRDYFFADR